MAAFLFFNFLLLVQPAFQRLDSNKFLIYNENLNLCIHQNAHSAILDYCNEATEGQHFKWVSNDQILNMAVNLCLAVPSNSSEALVTLLPCNKTSALQKWGCRNDTLALEGEELFLQPNGGPKSGVKLSKTSNSKSAWKIYGTKDSLCSKGYEELFTLGSNGFGAPCAFPFKYENKWYAECIPDYHEGGRLWCGTTADVDQDSLTGYCPLTDGHDELFWITNHWTGDHYQINHQSALTWDQARRSCQQQNAELVSITELNEQMYLAGLTSGVDNGLWIGLNSLDLDSGWQWIGNHPFRYLNWAPGNPSPKAADICGSMEPRNGKWKSIKCEQQLGYICKKENSSADASDIPSDYPKHIKCPDGWIAYAGQCYRLHRDSKTWKGAQLACRKEGGDLTSIHSIEEHSFVISQLGYNPTDLLWIGLNDLETSMYFEWSDRTKVRFTKWQRGEPMYIANAEKDCVIMSGENGYWAEYFCETELGFICKREPLSSVPEEPEIADPACPKDWKRHGLYCYLTGERFQTFSEAKLVCEDLKASLASVEDRYEHAYLTSLIGLHHGKYFWIGLSDVEQPGTFNWTNGDKVLFTHWNSQMPGQNSGCVAMRTGTAAGLWDVLNCEEKAHFLCKQRAQGVTPPPVLPPTTPPPCPKDWSPIGSRCFKVFNDGKKQMQTWFEARDFCQTIGGDLISIHSHEEQEVISQSFRFRRYWIGLNTLDPEKGVSWSDGSPVDVNNMLPWYSRDSNDQCTVSNFYFWRPSECHKMLPWACQINRGAPINPEPNDNFDYIYKRVEDGWIEFGGNEYYFSNRTLSAENARRFCKKNNGDLTVIENQNEQNFLWKYNHLYGIDHDAYIGLIVSYDRKFYWLDGSPVTFEAWAYNEPNFSNDDENCVAMTTYYAGLWNDINCGSELSFICERHNKSVRSSVAPTSPAPQKGCDEGWLLFHNKCFQMFGFHEEERKNWSEARAACRKLEADLTSIRNTADQAFLTMNLISISTDAWIGLYRVWKPRYLWTDGSTVSYTNWIPGFPNRNGECVAMEKRPEMQAGYWRNEPCSLKKSYICRKNTETVIFHSATTAPVSGYIRYGNSSYSVISSNMTWEDARKKCQSEDAELARILNPYSQSFLWLQVLKYGEPVWIGLNSDKTGKTYKWINMKKFIYTNWFAGEPKQNIACVYLDRDGFWKTATCSETHFFVCEKHHGIIPIDPPEVPGKCPEALSQMQRSWIPFQAHCYSFNTAKVSWSSASIMCAQLGSTLTSIEDLTEMNFLREDSARLGLSSYWIGLYKSVDGGWKWEDETSVDFVNWKSGEPRESDSYFNFDYEGNLRFRGKCIYMNSIDGEWSSDNCDYSTSGYICKTHKIVEEPTTEPSKKSVPVAAPASAHGTVVAVIVIFICISTGIAAYVFYKKRSYKQSTAGFSNSLYQEQLHNNDSESLAKSENKEGP
ncbi:macrophage mannose receptor 1-like [Hemicordylus capensis]|uniref:macrophage mannose receptor 1-like n=1 Tax=Hemicordylus capensis TaxID=884348 RepID=UPI002303F1F9|nr:macrophage mannose receptor 1-like [Hemicordylus capensis]